MWTGHNRQRAALYENFCKVPVPVTTKLLGPWISCPLDFQGVYDLGC
jgi:hypothetical protein